MPPVVSIVGKSKSGKTTLIEKLISELKSRRYRVATVKRPLESPCLLGTARRPGPSLCALRRGPLRSCWSSCRNTLSSLLLGRTIRRASADAVVASSSGTSRSQCSSDAGTPSEGCRRRMPWRQFGQQQRAGDGNRTRVTSLEGWSFTTKQHPPWIENRILELAA